MYVPDVSVLTDKTTILVFNSVKTSDVIHLLSVCTVNGICTFSSQLSRTHPSQFDVQATREDHAKNLKHTYTKPHRAQDDKMVPDLIC